MAQDSTLPAGYALVPIEPTEVMVEAFMDGLWNCPQDDFSTFAKGYGPMLAASPSPSDGGER